MSTARERYELPAALTVPDHLLELRRLGRARGPISLRQYDELRDREVSLTGVRLTQLHGGKWREVCALAGVEPAGPGRAFYQRRWTDRQVLEHVRQFLDDPPTGATSYVAFDRWCREQQGGPSAQTCRNQLALPWSELQARAQELR